MFLAHGQNVKFSLDKTINVNVNVHLFRKPTSVFEHF